MRMEPEYHEGTNRQPRRSTTPRHGIFVTRIPDPGTRLQVPTEPETAEESDRTRRPGCGPCREQGQDCFNWTERLACWDCGVRGVECVPDTTTTATRASSPRSGPMDPKAKTSDVRDQDPTGRAPCQRCNDQGLQCFYRDPTGPCWDCGLLTHGCVAVEAVEAVEQQGKMDGEGNA